MSRVLKDIDIINRMLDQLYEEVKKGIDNYPIGKPWKLVDYYLEDNLGISVELDILSNGVAVNSVEFMVMSGGPSAFVKFRNDDIVVVEVCMAFYGCKEKPIYGVPKEVFDYLEERIKEILREVMHSN